jgi:hypothetical protein
MDLACATAVALDPAMHALIVNATTPANPSRAGAVALVRHRVTQGSSAMVSMLLEQLVHRVILGDSAVRQASLALLADLGAAAQAICPPLHALLRTEALVERRLELRATLRTLAPDATPTRAMLIDALRSGPTEADRVDAARHLGALAAVADGLDAASVGALVEAMVDASHSGVQRAAAIALVSVLPTSPSTATHAARASVPWSASLAAAALALSMQDDVAAARAGAAVLAAMPPALALATQEHENVGASLATLTAPAGSRDLDDRMERVAALTALGAFPLAATRTVPVLLQHLTHPTLSVTEAAIVTLCGLTPGLPVAVQRSLLDTLSSRLCSDDVRWSSGVMRTVAALDAVRWHGALATVVARWACRDVSVAGVAVATLPAADARRLWTHWQRTGTEMTPLLVTLAARPDRVMTDADLVPFLTARDAGVRLVAVQLLSRGAPPA